MSSLKIQIKIKTKLYSNMQYYLLKLEIGPKIICQDYGTVDKAQILVFMINVLEITELFKVTKTRITIFWTQIPSLYIQRKMEKK